MTKWTFELGKNDTALLHIHRKKDSNLEEHAYIGNRHRTLMINGKKIMVVKEDINVKR